MRHEDEERKESGADARDAWFARQLGAQWWSRGDGIYYFAPQTDSRDVTTLDEGADAEGSGRPELGQALAPGRTRHSQDEEADSERRVPPGTRATQ